MLEIHEVVVCLKRLKKISWKMRLVLKEKTLQQTQLVQL